MSDERLLLKARIAENKAYLRKLSIRADAHFRTIRDIVDPLTGKDFIELDLEAAKVAMDDFYKLWKEGRKLKELIEKQEHALE